MRKIICLLFGLPLFAMAQSPLPGILKDINTGAGNTAFGPFSALTNSNIVFGVNTTSSTTGGLWTSDGSTAGTVQLKQLPFDIGYFQEYNGKQ